MFLRKISLAPFGKLLLTFTLLGLLLAACSPADQENFHCQSTSLIGGSCDSASSQTASGGTFTVTS